MMREFMELETSEICTTLGISSSNCWVILHRARIGLRECLENTWFGRWNMLNCREVTRLVFGRARTQALLS